MIQGQLSLIELAQDAAAFRNSLRIINDYLLRTRKVFIVNFSDILAVNGKPWCVIKSTSLSSDEEFHGFTYESCLEYALGIEEIKS